MAIFPSNFRAVRDWVFTPTGADKTNGQRVSTRPYEVRADGTSLISLANSLQMMLR
ncbi:MAG: hypothetical protein AAF679_06150 [Pseudomonadota bacterium]